MAQASSKQPKARGAKHHYVYSTQSNDTVYGGQQVDKPGQAARTTWRVLIKGGANVLNKRLQTAKGVVTKVTDEELNLLLSDKAFNRHMDAGFISHSPVHEDADEVAKNLESKDGSAQKTKADFAEGQKPKSGPAALERVDGSN